MKSPITTTVLTALVASAASLIATAAFAGCDGPTCGGPWVSATPGYQFGAASAYQGQASVYQAQAYQQTYQAPVYQASYQAAYQGQGYGYAPQPGPCGTCGQPPVAYQPPVYQPPVYQPPVYAPPVYQQPVSYPQPCAPYSCAPAYQAQEITVSGEFNGGAGITDVEGGGGGGGATWVCPASATSPASTPAWPAPQPTLRATHR